MEEETIKDRILKWIDYKNLSVASFERKCGLSTGYVANMKPNVNTKKINEMSLAFPDLNIEWLKTGEGEMIMPRDTVNQNGETNVYQKGRAGHDLTQTNNSEKILADFIEGLKTQNSVTIEIAAQAKLAINQNSELIAQMGKSLDEISEQRKLVDRLITIIENKNL